MSGVTIYTNAHIQTDGTLQVNGTYNGGNGDHDTLTVTVTQDVLVVGATPQSVVCDGTSQQWSAYVTPVGGSWSPGSAIGVAILLNGLAQIADGTQELVVYSS